MALTLIFGENKNQLRTRLSKAKQSYRGEVQKYMTKKAKELERYMKANRPWHDRTGAARKNLSARLSSSPKRYVQTIKLSHGVYYGVYLEYSMQRRFAIIEPTMRIKGPEIIDDLHDKLGMIIKMKGG